MSEFHHGHEPRAEEIALHQKYLTLEGQMDAARLEGDENEVRRLEPLVKRAKARWITANRRVTRGTKDDACPVEPHGERFVGSNAYTTACVR